MRNIPSLATSVPCGRLFSVVGVITDDRGSRLTTDRCRKKCGRSSSENLVAIPLCSLFYLDNYSCYS